MLNDAHHIRTQASLVWAKSEPQRHPPTQQWLPLWQHLDDTGAVAGFLWDHWLAAPIRALISAGLPDGHDDGRRLLTWLAGVHDIGKCSPAFAIQRHDLCDRMTRNHGFEPIGTMVHQNRSQLRHEIAGAIALDDWLHTQGFAHSYARRRPDAAAAFVTVVGAHHGELPQPNQINARGKGDLYGTGMWASARTFLLDRAAQRFAVTERLPEWRAATITPPAQMALCGIVVMADWIASSADYFPLLAMADVPLVPGASHTDENRIRVGLDRLDLSPAWRPSLVTDDLATRFAQRFTAIGHRPRPVQDAVATAAATMAVPGIMIVEAPMGEGKTEAAFLAAETLAARTGATGVLVALPTQATSNAMFTRTHDWITNLPSEGTQAASIALVHGKAALNEEYQEIRFPRRATIYDRDELTDSERTTQRMVAVVDEWMTGRKRAALSSFVVGTIDHVLFAALNARHIMLRHLALIGNVVILDEVHAADVYMSTFLTCALTWLGAAGTPVILMSATLPPAQRAALYDAYDAGRRAGQSSSTDTALAEVAAPGLDRLLGYPSVVSTGTDGPRVQELPPSGRRMSVALHTVVADDGDDLDAIVALLSERLRDGGCAVVIRNTVARVQKTARRLVEEFGADNVSIAHAQFLACDRIDSDAALLARFGPPGPDTERPHRHIVVASQVVEQSLDVDFDLMVTDIAPVDLVLQRMGRLHRHRRATRPSGVTAPECWLTGFDAADPQTIDAGSTAIYGKYRLLAALAVLQPHLRGTPVDLPGDIAPLVSAAYAQDLAAPAGWETLWTPAKRADHDRQNSRREHATSYLLDERHAMPGGSLLGAGRGSAGTINEDSPRAVGYVRDGQESIEVVVVQRQGGSDTVPDWVGEHGGELLPLREHPLDGPTARALALCTLRLPFALCHEGIVDQSIADLENNWFPGWKDSPHLAGSLALVLDEHRAAELSGHRVQYDPHWGLVTTKL